VYVRQEKISRAEIDNHRLPKDKTPDSEPHDFFHLNACLKQLLILAGNMIFSIFKSDIH